MEYINQVHLRGIVGRVSEETKDDRIFYRFSLATEYVYHSYQYPVIDTTWHDILYYAEKGERLKWLTKGAIAEVEGRIKMSSYQTATGEMRSICSVVVSSVKQITEG